MNIKKLKQNYISKIKRKNILEICKALPKLLNEFYKTKYFYLQFSTTELIENLEEEYNKIYFNKEELLYFKKIIDKFFDEIILIGDKINVDEDKGSISEMYEIDDLISEGLYDIVSFVYENNNYEE